MLEEQLNNGNKKILADQHFKVLYYEPESSKIFVGTDIKGGIAVSFRNSKKTFGAIDIFTPYNELNHILSKIIPFTRNDSISKIAFSRTSYRLTKTMHEENPNATSFLSKGHLFDMSTNIFKLLPFIFLMKSPMMIKNTFRSLEE